MTARNFAKPPPLLRSFLWITTLSGVPWINDSHGGPPRGAISSAGIVLLVESKKPPIMAKKEWVIVHPFRVNSSKCHFDIECLGYPSAYLQLRTFYIGAISYGPSNIEQAPNPKVTPGQLAKPPRQQHVGGKGRVAPCRGQEHLDECMSRRRR